MGRAITRLMTCYSETHHGPSPRMMGIGTSAPNARLLLNPSYNSLSNVYEETMMHSAEKLLGVCVMALIVMSTTVCAQTRRDQGELRGLKLGLDAATMSTDSWGEFACGSNGGPPRQRISDWSEFAKCRAEDNGLH